MPHMLATIMLCDPYEFIIMFYKSSFAHERIASYSQFLFLKMVFLRSLMPNILGAKIVAITILYPSTAVRMPVYDSRILSAPFELWLNLYKNLVVF